MKFLYILSLIIFVLLLPAAAQTSPQTAKKPAAPAKKSAKPAASSAPTANNLPAGAEKIGEYRWRYTDSAGKTWIYVQTPFGYSKVDEETHKRQMQEKNSEPATPGTITVVQETADAVTFETNTPFGKQRWQKKRTELSESEKAAVETASRVGKTKE